jgi:putative ABC transport system permease protein
MNDLIMAGLLQGLVLALVAYGVMIPLRLLNFADLTAEGAYPLGGAICATLITMGVPPGISLVAAILGAGLVGVATAFIHLRFHVNTLLAGIILSTMLYSVNLRFMGKPNIALFDTPSIFATQSNIFNLVLLVSILIALVVPLFLFLNTEFGLRLRAVGLNPTFAKSQGINVAKYTMLGLFLGNAFTGLAGGMMVQLQNYMDINMGVGIVIHALAALMIGECVIKNNSLRNQLLAPLVGALLYQQIQGMALSVGLAPSDLKLLTGGIVLSVIALRTKMVKANI